ncbi:hypothetical protein CPB83DRAFT_144150 [Crepidotus variabilis]|uniref:Pentatricopeptide repeat-containing protein n=1 Tax=Crepidotus variabilis TaxID=179855 RepID=A0A9P6JSL8_9AGAR|nr:hypothetical protein CPB83DRAFT_144150 [Crepidotus variabilis]
MLSAPRNFLRSHNQLPRLFTRFTQTLVLHDSTRQKVLVQKPALPRTKNLNGARATVPSLKEVEARKVVAHLRPILHFKNVKAVEEGVHKTLSAFPTASAHQAPLYEEVIRFLVAEMWAQPALSVFNRMQMAGFLPGQDIHAQVLTVTLSETKEHPEHLLRILQEIISSPTYTEDYLVNFLVVAKDYALPIDHVASCLTLFSKARGASYHPRAEVLVALMRIFSESGHLEQLFDTSREVEEAEELVELLEESDALEGKISNKFILHLIRSVMNPDSADNAVLQVLQVLQEAGADPLVVAHAADSYLANRPTQHMPSRELSKALVVAFINADTVDKAFTLLHRLRLSKDAAAHHVFIAALSYTRPNDNRSFIKILTSMNEAGLAIDTPIFNLLIAREVRLGRAGQALSMYSEMKSNEALQPDVYTFSSLFTLYRRVKPRSLKHHNTKDGSEGTTSPIRQLFGEVVLSSQRDKNPIQVQTSLLNTALRAFMRQRDYAAAIMVLQAFSHFQVCLDHKTYYAVVKMLVRRIWAEAQGSRPRDQVRWVDRLLGVEHYTEIKLGTALVQQIFSTLKRKAFDISAPLYLPRRVGRRRPPPGQFSRPSDTNGTIPFPSMEMMESVEPPEPLGFVYDPIPLQRFLAKAHLAQSEAQKGDVQRELDVDLATAAKEMHLL